MSKNSSISPTAAANYVLDELGITQEDLQKSLQEIVWQRGALIVDAHLDGSEASLNLAGTPAIITISTAINNDSRRRFNIVHELGHLELHQHIVTFCSNDDISSWEIKQSDKVYEYQASDFAASFLMPERFFASLCDDEPSLDYISELGEKFGTSLTATAVRYIHFTPEPVAVVFSQDGIAKWFRRSKEFEDLGLFVDIKARLSSDTKASSFFKDGYISKKPKEVEISAWCKQGDYPKDATLQEQTFAISSDSVLSLLFIDADLDEDYY